MMENALQLFYQRFNRNKSSEPETEESIIAFESELNTKLPSSFKDFLSSYGDVWTPDILDLVVEKDLDLNDVQDFWKIETIRNDMEHEWTSQFSGEIIPFASDCMGNLFVFKLADLKNSADKSCIYFFDHEFETLSLVSNSFVEWIKNYLNLA